MMQFACNVQNYEHPLMPPEALGEILATLEVFYSCCISPIIHVSFTVAYFTYACLMLLDWKYLGKISPLLMDYCKSLKGSSQFY